MMKRSNWRACPSCGLPNINERNICKRCRAPLEPRAAPAPAPARWAGYSDSTGRLYTSLDGQHRLLLFPQHLEYAGPELHLQSVWENVTGLRPVRGVVYLWLKEDAKNPIARVAYTNLDTWQQLTVPLTRFGYPSNNELLRDLRRFAPQISRLIH